MHNKYHVCKSEAKIVRVRQKWSSYSVKSHKFPILIRKVSHRSPACMLKKYCINTVVLYFDRAQNLNNE